MEEDQNASVPFRQSNVSTSDSQALEGSLREGYQPVERKGYQPTEPFNSTPPQSIIGIIPVTSTTPQSSGAVPNVQAVPVQTQDNTTAPAPSQEAP